MRNGMLVPERSFAIVCGGRAFIRSFCRWVSISGRAGDAISKSGAVGDDSLLLNGFLINLQCSRHQLLQLINPSFIARVSRHQCRRLLTLTRRYHPCPESDLFTGIVSRAGHVGKSDLVRLQFVLAAEW